MSSAATGESVFQVQLPEFAGPLDLLLYLVRKHELDVTQVPLVAIVEQFLRYLEETDQLDVNAAGDVLELVTLLAEIKAQRILPREEEQETLLPEEPQEQLVEHLLRYKQFRDLAGLLEERAQAWQQQVPRQANDWDQVEPDPAEQPIQELEIWDLVSALARLSKNNQPPPATNIVYDETPIEAYMEQIVVRVESQGRLAFTQLFRARMHKSALVGMFLAMMELLRRRALRVEQEHIFGEIWLLPGEDPWGWQATMPVESPQEAHQGPQGPAQESSSE